MSVVSAPASLDKGDVPRFSVPVGTVPTKSRVLVAMSGGVDSSVAALLLLEAGFEVVGMTFRLGSAEYVQPEDSSAGCCTAADAADARRVASQLGIDHYVVDISEEFGEAVVRPFVSAYAEGLTPNPCIECNRSIRFDVLLEKARLLECDVVATGHHARIAHSHGSGPHRLLRGRDPRKDQSYVLYVMTQEQLGRTVFPIGELTKDRVRSIAKAGGLRTAAKEESQGICFVGRHRVDDFLEKAGVELPRLEVVDGSGKNYGYAERLSLTIGQRRGVGAASGRRMYVKRLDPRRGIAILGARHELYARRLELSRFTWTDGISRDSTDAEVCIRYGAEPEPARVRTLGKDPEHPGAFLVSVELEGEVWAPAPGQAAVVYSGDEVLGGGIIREAG